MFKRTNGYILLTLLVLTGLAGRVTSETLNSKERRELITRLKDTRAGFLKTVSGLSDRQLDYRPGKSKPTIREYLHHMAQAEAALGALADKALETPAGRNNTPKISDADLPEHLSQECPVPFYLHAKPVRGDGAKEVLDQFKESRAKAIKYIRTTTENVRAHTTLTTAGPADPYQLYLGLCAHLERHTREVRAIMERPGFPKE